MKKPSRKEIDAEISRIYNENGSITPDLVIKAAEDPNNVLHHLFEWDNSKAGNAYRVDQARQIITSVKINIVTESRTISAVSYVRDPRLPNDQQGYISVAKLKTDKDLAKDSIRTSSNGLMLTYTEQKPTLRFLAWRTKSAHYLTVLKK
jgi:hypothetical protein